MSDGIQIGLSWGTWIWLHACRHGLCFAVRFVDGLGILVWILYVDLHCTSGYRFHSLAWDGHLYTIDTNGLGNNFVFHQGFVSHQAFVFIQALWTNMFEDGIWFWLGFRFTSEFDFDQILDLPPIPWLLPASRWTMQGSCADTLGSMSLLRTFLHWFRFAVQYGSGLCS